MPSFEAKKIKALFPIFKRKIKGKQIVYLDNASTTQKPKAVINAVKNYYEWANANIHRGIYQLSIEATEEYEKTRAKTAKFLNAQSEKEIIFTKGTTESINLIAYTYGLTNIKKGDEIIVSQLEHHSNLVPWQNLIKNSGAKLKVIPLKKDLTLDLKAFDKLLTSKTKLVCITAMSNILGTITKIEEITKKAHKVGAKVLIDAAQSAAHQRIDVQKLDCDFLAFSAHKIFGPTGVGILYGKQALLQEMPPFLFGGDMINHVHQYDFEPAELPNKFEAGTPNIAGVIGFSFALDFLEKLDYKAIQDHEKKLLKYAISKFSKYQEVKLLTPPPAQSGPVLSFTIKGIHPHDIAEVFNSENVCIRAGHHCGQPLMEHLKLPATARMSFSIYNTIEDIDIAEKALQKTLKLFK